MKLQIQQIENYFDNNDNQSIIEEPNTNSNANIRLMSMQRELNQLKVRNDFLEVEKVNLLSKLSHKEQTIEEMNEKIMSLTKYNETLKSNQSTEDNSKWIDDIQNGLTQTQEQIEALTMQLNMIGREKNNLMQTTISLNESVIHKDEMIANQSIVMKQLKEKIDYQSKTMQDNDSEIIKVHEQMRNIHMQLQAVGRENESLMQRVTLLDTKVVSERMKNQTLIQQTETNTTSLLNESSNVDDLLTSMKLSHMKEINLLINERNIIKEEKLLQENKINKLQMEIESNQLKLHETNDSMKNIQQEFTMMKEEKQLQPQVSKEEKDEGAVATEALHSKQNSDDISRLEGQLQKEKEEQQKLCQTNR